MGHSVRSSEHLTCMGGPETSLTFDLVPGSFCIPSLVIQWMELEPPLGRLTSLLMNYYIFFHLILILISVIQPFLDRTICGDRSGGVPKGLNIVGNLLCGCEAPNGLGQQNSVDRAWSQRWSAHVPPCPDDVRFDLWAQIDPLKDGTNVSADGPSWAQGTSSIDNRHCGAWSSWLNRRFSGPGNSMGYFFCRMAITIPG